MNEIKKPKLRFKGFEEEWKEKRLDKIIEIKNGKDYKHLHKGNIPVFGTGGYILSVDKALSYNNAIGIGRKGTINKPYILYAPFWTVDTLFYAIPNKGNDLNFIYNIFQKIDWQRKDESTGVPSLSKQSINCTKVQVAESSEQQKIGSFFKDLDHIIAKYEQKITKLKNIKLACLEKMFPKNDAKIPELRFKGFKEEWKEKRLGAFCLIKTGYPFSSKNFTTNGSFLIITNGNIQNESSYVNNSLGNKINISDKSIIDEYGLNIGDILVTMDGTVGRTAMVANSQQILAQRVGRLIIKDNSNFLYHSLNTGSFYKKMTLISHGGTIKHISLSEISEYLILVSKDSKEQQKIGSFFKHLDHIIAKNEQKITKLKNIKQACLEKMFVNTED